MTYRLYVIDEKGNSASWSHTNGHRGKACMVFPDDKDLVIVLEHESLTTHLYITDGVMEIETMPNEPEPEPEPEPPRKRQRSQSRRSRRR